MYLAVILLQKCLIIIEIHFHPELPRRPNFQGWIVAILIAAILGITFFNRSSAVRETTIRGFEKMVKNKEVEKVVIVNNEVVEITLTQQALQQKYRTQFQDKSYFNSESGPHFSFRVSSAESFKKDLDRIQEGIPDNEKIDYKIEQRSDWSGFLQTWGFFIVMILAMYFLLGRMSAGPGRAVRSSISENQKPLCLMLKTG